jgi:glycosyltransferase involved in cell wall biosynthesis
VSYVVHRLANILMKRGHELTVYSFDPAPDDALYSTVRLPLAAWGEPLLGRLILTPLILSRLDLGRFDVMHAHGDDHLVLRRPVPWVRTLYGSARRERDSAVRLRRRLSQSVLVPLEVLSARAADVTVGISRDTAACVPGIDEIIPCGVDLDLFRPSDQPRSAFPSILFVGTVHGRKRGDLLLDVFQRHIRPALPTAELWMVCEPEAARDGVRWWGKVSTEQLVQLYQQAWVFCLPSTYEGFGIPYVEALACGTPVVASHNPGAREVLDEGRYGFMTYDDQLAHAILAILQDSEHRQQLGQISLARAAQYEWNCIAARYEQVYERACRERRVSEKRDAGKAA